MGSIEVVEEPFSAGNHLNTIATTLRLMFNRAPWIIRLKVMQLFQNETASEAKKQR